MFSAWAVQSLAWVTRTFPDLPGRWRVTRWLDAQHDTFARLTPRTVRVARAWRMLVDPADENGRRVYVRGFEVRERITRQFLRILRPGDHVVDVGANLGYYTLVAARAVGANGSVHAFEPSPDTLPLLRQNAALNARRRITVHCAAVCDACGTARFDVADRACTGYSSLRPLGDDAAASYEVPTITLDSVLDTLPTIRLVKLDIEGAELRALRGMRRLLERDRPHVICEVDDNFLRALDGSAAALFAFLRERGYTLGRIVARGAVEPVTEPPAERCNILATP